MGISNEVFVLSGGFLIEAVAELQLLPLLVFTALICPPGLEGSVYSVMMSVRNLGAALGKLSSSIATYAFAITACDFHRLVPFILVCSLFTLLPLCFIQLIPTTVEMDQVRHANMKGAAASRQATTTTHLTRGDSDENPFGNEPWSRLNQLHDPDEEFSSSTA